MDKLSFKLTLKYTVLIIGFLLTSLTVVLYGWHNQWAFTLDSVIKILGLGVGATTALYAAMNLRHISDSHITGVDLKKKEFSARLMERWLDPEMTKISIEANTLLREIKEINNSDEAYKLFDSKYQQRVSLVSLLSFFELMTISINNDLADEKMLHDFFRGVVCSNYNIMKPVIEVQRKEHNNQKIFEHFESLARKWS